MEKQIIYRESLLDLKFLQSEKFKQKDQEQLKRIEKKLLTLYELRNTNLRNLRNDEGVIRDIHRENVKVISKLKKERFSRIVENYWISKEIKQNIFVGIISLSSYFYFTRVSKMFYNIYSLALFRPLFLFTFCGAPLVISIYFSYLNLDAKDS